MICDKLKHHEREGREDGVRVVDGAALDFAGIFANDLIPTGGAALVLSTGVRDDRINEIAHGVDLRRDGIWDAGAHLLVERDEKLDALHGVESEIQFEVVGGMRRVFLELGGGLDDSQRLATAGCCIHSVSSGVSWRGRAGRGLRAFAALHALLDFEALDLAGAGAGQIVLPDFVAQDALGGRHLRRQSFDFEAQHVADVDDLSAAERFEVGHDDAVKTLGEGLAGRALQADDADFLDVGRLLVMRLDLFRIDVLAVAEDDDIFLAPGDVEVAAVVAVAEIAGEEPAVAIHGGGDVGALVVSGHDDAAANGDLADGGSAVLGRWGTVEDFHIVAWQRLADGAHHDVIGRSDAGSAGGFGHAVGLEHGEAHGLELMADGGIESRASGDEVTHVHAEQMVDFAEEYIAEIDVELSGEGGDGQHSAEDGADGGTFLLHLALNAVVDQVEELRYAAEDGYVALLERPQQFGGVERFDKDDAHADRQRQQQVGHLGECVEEREDAEDCVSGADVDDAEDGNGFGFKVAVREHDALGIAGGSRSVEKGGDVVVGDGGGMEVAWAFRKDGAQVGEALFVAFAIDENDLDGEIFDGVTREREVMPIGEEQHGVGIEEKLADLVGMEGGVERYGCVAGGDDAEVGGHPPGMVGGEEGALRTFRDVGLEEPVADGLGHVAELGESVALDRSCAGCDGGGFALQLYGDQVRELAYRFRKAVVEHARAVRSELG